MEEVRQSHLAVYEANAGRWDAERSRRLFERSWIDRFAAHVPAGGAVLDLGCGAGDPIARNLIERGLAVTGMDFSGAMLAIARDRFPDACWLEGDMRQLDLGRQFAGVIAWDSFFHLAKDEQRAIIPRLARHLSPGGALLMTVGPQEGEALGKVGDGAVYHASLSPAEYADRLRAVGLAVVAFVANDPDCAGHSVLLAVAQAGD